MDPLPPGAREAWEVKADEEEERELCVDFSQVATLTSQQGGGVASTLVAAAANASNAPASARAILKGLQECPHCFGLRKKDGLHVFQDASGVWQEDREGTIQCSCTK